VAPLPGASDDPVTLADNFIQACAAGVSGTFVVAQEYLTPAARQTWDPEAKVTVFGSGDFTPVWNEGAQTVTYSLPVIATIDATGIFTEVDPGTPQDITFAMAQEATGKWRISGIDSGIVLAGAHFDDLFRPVEVAFASADGPPRSAFAAKVAELLRGTHRRSGTTTFPSAPRSPFSRFPSRTGGRPLRSTPVREGTTRNARSP
jgi:hypothetical protein